MRNHELDNIQQVWYSVRVRVPSVFFTTTSKSVTKRKREGFEATLIKCDFCGDFGHSQHG